MRRTFDLLLAAFGLAVIGLFTTRYRMPFRLDDILLMEWSLAHHWWDAFDPIKGQLVNSYRPMFALAAYGLTHVAGWAHPFWWHLKLCSMLIIGLAFVGLTARYIAGRWYALEVSVLLYPVAFATILNVFFWYSDLTYGLELVFTAPAWYFGLRGLREGQLTYWLLAMLLGTFAVLSKEPAVVLVHVVLIWAIVDERAWTKWTGWTRWPAFVAYSVLLVVTVFILSNSPTRGNRFLSLSAPGIGEAVRERINYYSAVYLAIAPRLLIFFPIVFIALREFVGKFGRGVSLMDFLSLSVMAVVAALLVFTNVLVAVPLLFFILMWLAIRPNPEQARARRLLPFVLCLMLAVGALLFTVQLVKTQLTEVAILSIIIGGWAWSVWVEEVAGKLKTVRNPRARIVFASLFAVLGVFVIVAAVPKLKAEEQMLRDVRDVRQNANDALTWSAKNLPQNSLFAVCVYSLHGIEHQNLLTPKDDATKLRSQYTFDGGFVYHVLEVLGRRDIRHAYLEDSTMLPQVLAAMRQQPNSYLFLQSELDLKLFHGEPSLITSSDSLVTQFARGPYPCEVWLLR
ncbi:MAG: hypothetical protein Q8922_11420 [Bacteroidota bacterium]|nr:hypothetical protein [Bacteroidota bacterium]MDP4233608.1 hypothetical protein [Bacteroidota bacterium]MDP4243132.1 hypothetical protein [Bacteroidota bacterium]MDP4288536.1 hypothetical protein [Bacteroidota bacterium]